VNEELWKGCRRVVVEIVTNCTIKFGFKQNFQTLVLLKHCWKKRISRLW